MKINILRGSLIRVLALSVLFTTYSTILNVSAMDVSEDFYQKETQKETQTFSSNLVESDVQITRNHKKNIELNKKELRKKKQNISNQEITRPETLEEAIDLSQYATETVMATGYTAGPESTGKSPGHPLYGVTYSGVQVRRDLYSTIAADLNKFPIGTILFIPGYGYGVVADKGGAIKGDKIDLYYETIEDVYEYWGKKEVEVYVIEKGNGKLTSKQLDELNETESLQAFRQNILEE